MYDTLGIHEISTLVLGDRLDGDRCRTDDWFPIIRFTCGLTACWSGPGDGGFTRIDPLIRWIWVSFIFPTPRYPCALWRWDISRAQLWKSKGKKRKKKTHSWIGYYWSLENQSYPFSRFKKKGRLTLGRKIQRQRHRATCRDNMMLISFWGRGGGKRGKVWCVRLEDFIKTKQKKRTETVDVSWMRLYEKKKQEKKG